MAQMEEVKIQTNPTRLKSLVVGNKVFRSSYDCEISPEDVERARLELGETEDVRENSLRTLKEMLCRDETRYRTDDAYLLRFLRFKKFNCEEAYKMVRYFYSVREKHPHVFYTFPEDFEELLRSNLFTYLPYRDQDGSIVFVDKFGRWNAEKYSLYNLLQLCQTLADVITLNPACQINKIVGIYDFEGTHIRHFITAINPISMVIGIKMLQNMHPWRIKCVLLVNCNKFVLKFLNLIRHILKKKVAEKIIILGSDMSELHKYVNPAILPKEYGGSLEEYEWSTAQHIMDNLPYLQYERSFRNAKEL